MKLISQTDIGWFKNIGIIILSILAWPFLILGALLLAQGWTIALIVVIVTIGVIIKEIKEKYGR